MNALPLFIIPLFLASGLFAGEKTMAPQVGVLVEHFELDHAALPPLLEDYQRESAATGLLERVRKMADRGDARLTESTYVLVRDGQRTGIESIRELIYPTEHDPAEFFPRGGETDGPTTESLTVIPARMTNTEMRPVGNTLDVDVDLDGEFVRFNIAPKLVEFHGFDRWGKDEAGTVRPRFHSMQGSSALIVKEGTAELLGVHTPPNARRKDSGGKRVLCFVSPLSFHDVEVTPKPEEKPSLPVIRTHLEFIETDAELAGRLIRGQGHSVDATAIQREFDEQIAKGKAKVLHSNFLLTESGERAASLSVQEYDYPTESDPPSGVGLSMAAAETRVKYSPPPVSALGPYEKRDLGTTFELEAHAAAGGKSIALNVATEHVRLARLIEYGKGRFACQQPVFETLRLKTAVTVPDGKPILLGMHSLETARAAEMGTKEERAAVRNRRVLVFVTAKIKTLE